MTPFCALWYLNFSILTSLRALVIQPSKSSVSATLVHVTIGIRVNATGNVIQSLNCLLETVILVAPPWSFKKANRLAQLT